MFVLQPYLLVLHLPFDEAYPFCLVRRWQVYPGLHGRPVAETLYCRCHLPGIEVPARAEPFNIFVHQFVELDTHEQLRIAKPLEILRFHVRQSAPCLHCELAEYHVQIAVLWRSSPWLTLRTLDNGPARHQSVCTSLEALPVDVGVQIVNHTALHQKGRSSTFSATGKSAT